MQSSGGVADENIAILCLKRCNCIKNNGGGICALAVLNDRNIGALGVAGGKHHGTSVRFVHCGKFAD